MSAAAHISPDPPPNTVGLAEGSPREKKALDHITPLDGLRGIAVILVLCIHFGWTFPETTPVSHALRELLWVGWVGVDLFFVLSGYLITRGLVAPSSQASGVRLRKFWARRVLRIFPLYYIVLLVGSAVCVAVGVAIPTLPYWFYFQNYALAYDPYVLRWTAPFWSLAIEEQFYFLWPLLALKAPRGWLVAITVTLALGCVVARGGMGYEMHVLEHAGDPEAALQVAKIAYRATPTHMDGLLLGALLAILGRDRSSALSKLWTRLRPVVLGVTTLATLGLMAVTHGFNNYDGRVIAVGYAVLALFFASVVSVAVDGALYPAFARLLESRPLRACGRVSYGMYLLHWPIVVFTIPTLERLHASVSPAVSTLLGLAVVLVGIGVTYALAEVSFRFIETPFLRLKERFHE